MVVFFIHADVSTTLRPRIGAMVLSSHTFVIIESCRLVHSNNCLFGDILILEGWALSSEPIRQISLTLPDGIIFPIVDVGLVSEDVWRDQGKIFGDSARRARFRLETCVGDVDLRLSEARLVIQIEQDVVWQRQIGGLFQRDKKERSASRYLEIFEKFESIGDNCEFGLLQREAGVNRSTLLRYARVGSLARLTDAIRDGFAEFGTRDGLVLKAEGRECFVNALGGTLQFHTGIQFADAPAKDVLERQRLRLTHLSTKFIRDLEISRRTLVYRARQLDDGESDMVNDVRELYRTLRRRGPCRMLWVSQANEENGHGTIVQCEDQLYRGYIHQLSPNDNAFSFDADAWAHLLKCALIDMSSP